VSATQWTGQIPPSLAKCGVVSGCQSWVKATVALAAVAIAISRLTTGTMASPPATDRPGRVGKVVLEIHHDKACRGVVALHGPERSRLSAGSAT
jgi:hypothetical protein